MRSRPALASLPGPLLTIAVLAVAVPVGTAPAPAADPRPAVAAPAARFSWPLAPPHPVLRPFEPPSAPWGPGHRGVDLGGTPGEAVLVAADGEVISVDHAGGLRTTYEPVTPTVTAGQTVGRGTILGHLQAGHPGCPAPACLHWGLRRGEEYLDPLALVTTRHVRLLPLAPANGTSGDRDGTQPHSTRQPHRQLERNDSS